MEETTRKAATVIYINSEFMGNGDDELGALVLDNFLSTLGDFVQDISHILLVNSGVKIICEGSDKLDMMTMLEESGLKILACGTCLKHFQLQDRLKAGKMSNMFSILEAITGAEKVLTP